MSGPAFLATRKAGVAVAAAALIADQITKIAMLNHVFDGAQRCPDRYILVNELTAFFNLVMTCNRGVSFGMFNQASDHGPLLLTGLAVVIIIALSVWLWRARTAASILALGMIIGGAAGNVIDRVRFGAVVDFLDFHAAGYHWPAFNIADSAVCVGAAILVLESLFTRGETS